jgi:putative acetyltransferase
MPLVIERVTRATDDVRALVEELETELEGSYSAEQRHGLKLEQIFQPGILFFVARLDGAPVGCGGLAVDDGFAELKRMFVRPQARGRGVAQALLARLKQEARARGYDRLVLETGDVLKPAIRLYERAGFKRCAVFGHYKTMRPHTIARSLFFEKRLD